MHFIDPALIPPKVLTRKSIDDLNALYKRLEARRVSKITIPEPPSGFRPSNLVRIYSQSHLRRCLVLARSAYGLFFLENSLVSLISVRAIYETVAVYCSFERQFLRLLANGTLQEIYDFAQNKAHATRHKKMIDQHGVQVRATNVETEITKLKSVRGKIEEEYSFLSDHTHPAGFGTVLYFAGRLAGEDAAIFHDAGPEPDADLQWVLIGIKLLEEFEKSYDRVEAALPALSARGHTEKNS